MISVVLIQVIMLIIVTFSSGIIEILERNSFDILNQTIESKSKNVENEMIQHWSNITESESIINDTIMNKIKDNGLSTKDLYYDEGIKAEILNDVSKYIIFMLRKNYVTGAYIIFDGEAEEKQGVYFRDLDPNSNPKDNSDLLMERGPASVSKKMGIPLNTSWNNRFIFNSSDEASPSWFFINPLKAAKENKREIYKKNDMSSFKDFGYWSRPFALSPKDIKVITYSVPLLDENQEPYAVLGIDISLNYLNSLLNYEEIELNGKGVYILGVDNNKDKNFEKLTSTGPMINNIMGQKINLKLNEQNVHDSIYDFNMDNSDEKAYACVKYMQLYNTNTPFENEKWAIMGVIEKDVLLNYPDRFEKLLILSIIASSLIGIIVVVIAARRVTRPIISLADEVRDSDPRNQLILKKINISEIDELSSAIMALSNNVADSASKLSQIIKLFNMPIGAFEYKKGQEMVYCTEAFFDIIGIDEFEKDKIYVDIKTFDEIIEKIISSDINSFEDIYKINGKTKWIKLKILEEQSRILGVVSDVTQEILEKQKIEYERDYDLLTDILNRRAFFNIVEEKLGKTNLKTGAFIMWDLDNLKYVNDTYGHDYGDEYIRITSVKLKRFEEYGGVVARRSGDEFYVFLCGFDTKDQIREIIREVHENIENTTLKLPNNRELKIRISTGIAWYPDDAESFENLSKFSDFAMYKIKRTVKGNISEFNKDEYVKDSFLLSSQEDLNKLLDEELIKYAFQPIVNAKTGKIFAYEALMRPTLETLKSPLDIIKLATADSRLYEIERITFFKALAGLVDNKEKFKDAKLFLNSIPNQALSNKDSEKFEELYGKYLDKVVIELLENERSNGENIAKKRKLMEKWGCMLAIDDFGSGYNNEAVLLAITPDFVKIDMGIVRGIDKDLNRQQISKNLITYAKQRGIQIIAEGVETKEELEKLIEIGADYVQGYYISKPEFIPPEIRKELESELLEINNRLNNI